MNTFTIDQGRMLQDLGFEPAWIEDLSEGDEFAIKVSPYTYGLPRDENDYVGRSDYSLRICTVLSIRRNDASHYDMDIEGHSRGEWIPHFIMDMVVLDHNLQLKKHMTYGRGWAIYRKAK